MRIGPKTLTRRYWKLWLLLAIVRTALLELAGMLTFAGFISDKNFLWLLLPEASIPNFSGELDAFLIFVDTVAIGYVVSVVLHMSHRNHNRTEVEYETNDVWPPPILKVQDEPPKR